MSRITLSWSFEETMFTSWFLAFFISSHGDRGKQLVPPNMKRLERSLDLYVHVSISAKMQPMPHMSAGSPYYFSTSITSGGRYHLEMTWLERALFFRSLWGLSSLSWRPVNCRCTIWLGSLLNCLKLETVKLNLLLLLLGVLKVWPKLLA